jgi:hypothetical protein
MKLVTLAFLATLLYLHGLGRTVMNLSRPLSMFRDGRHAPFGYTLFALLLVAGGLMVVAAVRARRAGAGGVYAVATVLLAVVAATPSLDDVHILTSYALMLLLYAYYAACFYRAGRAWLMPHLAVPVVVLLATQGHSYGLWQKSVVVYFVLVIGGHHHVLTRGAPRPFRALRGASEKLAGAWSLLRGVANRLLRAVAGRARLPSSS